MKNMVKNKIVLEEASWTPILMHCALESKGEDNLILAKGPPPYSGSDVHLGPAAEILTSERSFRAVFPSCE